MLNGFFVGWSSKFFSFNEESSDLDSVSVQSILISRLHFADTKFLIVLWCSFDAVRRHGSSRDIRSALWFRRFFSTNSITGLERSFYWWTRLCSFFCRGCWQWVSGELPLVDIELTLNFISHLEIISSFWLPQESLAALEAESFSSSCQFTWRNWWEQSIMETLLIYSSHNSVLAYSRNISLVSFEIISSIDFFLLHDNITRSSYQFVVEINRNQIRSEMIYFMSLFCGFIVKSSILFFSVAKYNFLFMSLSRPF